MKQNEISELPSLLDENFENIFNIYFDGTGRYYYNLLQNIAFPDNLPEGYFTYYTITYSDTWPYISYKLYNTPNLWWIILPFNNIIDPTRPLEPGTRIKALNLSYVKSILSQIQTEQNT
jgi:hypothetical protein